MVRYKLNHQHFQKYKSCVWTVYFQWLQKLKNKKFSFCNNIFILAKPYQNRSVYANKIKININVECKKVITFEKSPLGSLYPVWFGVKFKDDKNKITYKMYNMCICLKKLIRSWSEFVSYIFFDCLINTRWFSIT